MRTATSSNPTTGSRKRWTRPCACGAVGRFWTGRATRLLQAIVTKRNLTPRTLGRGAGGCARCPRRRRRREERYWPAASARSRCCATPTRCLADRDHGAGADPVRNARGLPWHRAPADHAPACSGMVSTASTTATSSGRWCANRAFAQYRYRDDLYPSLCFFRHAYDALCTSRPQGADRACGCSTWPRASEDAVTGPQAAAGPAAGADLRRGARSGARARHRPPAGRWDRVVLDLGVYDRLLATTHG